MNKTATRKAAVAGSFYPENPKTLERMIKGYIKEVPTPKVAGEVKVLLAPHAGYIYSGSVAAHAYKQVEGASYDAVVVIAVSHHYPFKGASIFDGDSYETPLGKITLDTDVINDWKETIPLISCHAAAHLQEHSLEVHLPFLQVALGTDFRLIPIVLGDTRFETSQVVAEALAKLAETKNILVVASTDLSHFLAYDVAKHKDLKTVETLITAEPKEVYNYFSGRPDSACGRCPIVTSLVYADMIGAKKRTLLQYANSGDTAGDKDRVVGYLSVVITDAADDSVSHNDEDVFSGASKQELLELVRATIKQKLATGRKENVESANPQLQGENGAFVTLHTASGALRGCIGNFVSKQPLYKTIQEMALASAFKDPRFPPVSEKELDDLKIEISVLSPMKKIDDVETIELGKHGIYIKKGFQSGTFLPQVATETGWNLEEFLGHCAQDKAGIGWDGWKTADVYTYTADVFGEE